LQHICCGLATRQIQTSFLAPTFRARKSGSCRHLHGSEARNSRWQLRDTNYSTNWPTPKTTKAVPPSNFTRMARVLDRHTAVHRTSPVWAAAVSLIGGLTARRCIGLPATIRIPRRMAGLIGSSSPLILKIVILADISSTGQANLIRGSTSGNARGCRPETSILLSLLPARPRDRWVCRL